MNSSYGKLMENVNKYTTCKITRIENIRNQWLNPLLKSVDALGDENVFEVNSQKRRIDDDKLVHLGLAVLHMSKLLLMEFIYFLEDVLEQGSYKILYLDTDSVFLGLTKSQNVPAEPLKHFKQLCSSLFDPIIKPSKREKFEREKSKWFVLDQTNESKRKPG